MLTKAIRTFDGVLDFLFTILKQGVKIGIFITIAGAAWFTAAILLGYTLVK